ncbi:hypothetical protein G7054_g9829 [Neopestalotiopsis clavispora]|nr:hypothetical protein G7054_g9829 [Neopestalotiopsis clavispora]
MTVFNDCPQHITVIVDNNDNMSEEFPNPSNIASGANASACVDASTWPGQSSFDISFYSGDKMHILLGPSPVYATVTIPPYLPNGKGGAVLAPGLPSATGGDYNFWFFNGPGILTPLINSFLQANLPAMVDHISSNSIDIKISETNELTIRGLQLDPASVQCTYAGILPKSGGGSNLWNLNVVSRVGEAYLVGTETIGEHTGVFNLAITDMVVYIQAHIDLTFQTKPHITALQCSLGHYHLSGTIIQLLEASFPLIAKLFSIGATPFRVAGFINTIFNTSVIGVINSLFSELIQVPDPKTKYASSLIHSLRFGSSVLAYPRRKVVRVSRPPLGTDLSIWMSTPQIQARKMGWLKLPGTHSSATYGLTPILSQIVYPHVQFLWNLSGHASPIRGKWPIRIPPERSSPLYIGLAGYNHVLGRAVNAISRTQGRNVLEQLQSGIRHFDFRVYYDTRDGHFYTQHILRGPLFSDVLAQIRFFINAHPGSGELIFAAISHTNFGHHPAQAPRFAELVASYIAPENLYYEPDSCGQPCFDFQILAEATVGDITQGAPKVMFMNLDWRVYAFSSDNDDDDENQQVITNTDGYAGAPIRPGDEPRTVDDLSAQQGLGLRCHHPDSAPLWSVDWVLTPDLPTVVQTVLVQLTGVQKWALQDMAAQANAALAGFLNQHGGADARFNVVSVDWLEYGAEQSVSELVIGMNN